VRKAAAIALSAALALALPACTGTGGDPGLPSLVLMAAGDTAADAEAALDRLAQAGHRTEAVTPAQAAGDSAGWAGRLIDVTGDYDIVIAPGDLAGSVNTVAAGFPDQHYLLYDGRITANNITSLEFRNEEAGFLAGVLAGLVTTRADQFAYTRAAADVALVAAEEGAATAAYVTGFVAGAHAVDPLIQVQTAYAAATAGEADVYDIALGLFADNGADVVAHTLGAAGEGVLRAAQDIRRYAIGFGANQNGLRAGNVLATLQRHTGAAVEDAVARLQDGSLVWGETVSLGLAEDAFGLVYDDNFGIVPPAIQELVAEYAQKVVDWEIQVPKG